MPERVQIVVPGDNPQQIQGSPRLDMLAPYGDVTVYTDRPTSFEQQIERAKDATILLNSRGAIKWPGEVLRQLPKLKFITVFGIGTDSIDLVTAKELGIVVSNIPGKTAPVVAPVREVEESWLMMFLSQIGRSAAPHHRIIPPHSAKSCLARWCQAQELVRSGTRSPRGSPRASYRQCGPAAPSCRNRAPHWRCC